ncbi:MAG: zinc-binding alcohol dehydrogenase family protein [Myxococcota bacterium]
MKALQIEKFGGPEAMQIVDVPVPEPRAGRVRVKVEAVGLNYSDIMIREGFYIDNVPLPYVMGREFCGRIDALGPEVSGLKAGQRVIASSPGGAMAEYIVVAAGSLLPCPEELTTAEGAAILIAGITAVHCLQDCARLKPGETVLIHAAAGGVGTLAVQIANAMGAKVIGTASRAEKCRFVSDLGALAIDYTQGDWVKEVLSATGGRGADVILESVGGEIFTRSFREALAIFGRMVVYGMAGRELATIENRNILESNRTLTGYYLGAFIPKYLDHVASGANRLVNFIREGAVKPVIGKTFPLAEAVDAFNHMQQRKNVGKVIITP